MNRNVLVSGGCSGLEVFPPKFVRSLRRKPVAGVKTVIPNPLAIEQGVHTVDHEYSLMMAFGVEEPRNNEELCAAKLKRKAKKFDLVADIHTSPTTAEMYAIVGVEAKPIVWEAVAALGVRRVVLADTPGSFYDHILHGLTIECPETVTEKEQERLRAWLGRVAAGEALSEIPEYELYKYTGFVERGVVWNAPDFLPDFTQLMPRHYRHLGLRGPLYALGWFASGTSVQGEIVREAKGWHVVDGQLVQPEKKRR